MSGWAGDEATSKDVGEVKKAIDKFNTSSKILSIFMLILAIAQVFLGIMMFLGNK